jgi:hypothetical protein
MTAQVHDHPIHDAERRPDGPGSPDGGLIRPARPRWLVPALAVGLAAAALVVGGVISLSSVLYFGFFGGMILMHFGGHGGHGGHANDEGQDTREGHGGDTTPGAGDLSSGSHRSHVGRPSSVEAPQDSASIESNGSERQDHDQHRSHGCH